MIKPLRVAMYQRYNGGNADEGWTRLLFEQFDQPYKTIFDPEIKSGQSHREVRRHHPPLGQPGNAHGSRWRPAWLVAAGPRRLPERRAGRASRRGRDNVDPNPRGGGGNAVLGGAGGRRWRGGAVVAAVKADEEAAAVAVRTDARVNTAADSATKA